MPGMACRDARGWMEEGGGLPGVCARGSAVCKGQRAGSIPREATSARCAPPRLRAASSTPTTTAPELPLACLVEGVGGLDGLHVHVGALCGAALVRVAGVERARVVGGDGGRQLVNQRLDGLGRDQLNLRCV